MASIKARENYIVGDVKGCLRKCVERVKGLKSEKIFILFLKCKKKEVNV